MNTGIPKTLTELNKAKELCLSPAALNDKETVEAYCKAVHHYQFSDQVNFILLSHQANERLMKDIEADQGLRKFEAEEEAHKLMEADAKNEFMGYRFARAFKMNIPEYSWIPDHKNKVYNIALSPVKGKKPKDYLANPDNKEHINAMKKEIGYSLAVATLLGYYDLHDKNYIIENHKPVFFDFDQSLNSSTCWDSDPNENKKRAVELLENFMDVLPDSGFSIHLLMDELTNKNLLKDFKEAKENLNVAKGQFHSIQGKRLYNGLHDRADACIEYLKNKI